jgi:cell division protein FtsZ
MTINLKAPELRELKPRIMVCGVGGAGGNAVNNMIVSGLSGVDFIVANTDAQALTSSRAERIIQMGLQVTEGLGAGSHPEVGRAAAEEAMEEIRDHLAGAHMVFVTAGMGGGTGTGAAPVVARTARDQGILTVGVVTKPFQFEGPRRMRVAEAGINELQKAVDTLIVIPNQNLFRIANERTTFADAFAMADQVLYSGVACITDLMVKEGLINLDFADVRAIMREMGKAMMGTGEATGEKRAMHAAEAAIANPLLDEVSMRGARGLLISITGGNDLTLYEVDEAASRIRQEVDEDANVILGATFDEGLDGIVRVSVVATGIDQPPSTLATATEQRIAEVTHRLKAQSREPHPQARIAQPIDTLAEPASAPVAAPAQPASVIMAHEVELRPAMPKSAGFHEMPETSGRERAEAAEPPAGPFIPPAAEEPLVRPLRMPRVEELPLPAQNQLRAQRTDSAEAATHVEAKRRSLLERLASFGIGRHEEQDQAAARPSPAAQPAPPPAAPPSQPAGHAEYGKRPAPARQPLDQHGRITPPARQVEDDQLEIPAFLRRQSS